MKNLKDLLFYVLAVCSLMIVGCDEDPPAQPECTLTCAANEVLLADCTCLDLSSSPCDGISCPTGYVCDGGDCVPDGQGGKSVVGGFITSNTTWSKDTIYELAGKVVVPDGVTLTIEPGTLIKGQAGVGSLASALVIAQGAKLMAMGTPAEPIIMTSIDDNIAIGQNYGTNLTETSNGLWGGLLILGKAPISVGGDAEFAQIEGIPADDEFGKYGGTDPTDNSGVIQYVSVRHGGALIGDGNEINGITLGGVGNGTVIENIEVVANQDDGIEWFGGTVDVNNVLIWAADDDGIDIDQAYSGTVDNFVVICKGTDHALEIDGPEGAAIGSFYLSNGSVLGDDQELGNMRDGATGTLSNIYFFGFSEDPKNQIPCTEGDDCFDTVNNGTKDKGEGDFRFSGDNTDAAYVAGMLSFSGFEITPVEGALISNIFKDFTQADQDAIGTVMSGANTVGADLSKFDWTYAKAAGKLDSF